VLEERDVLDAEPPHPASRSAAGRARTGSRRLTFSA
jgi:hypothetical protein